MRILVPAIPLLLITIASSGFAQSAKPPAADPLAGLRAHLRQPASLPASHKIYLDYKAALAKRPNGGLQHRNGSGHFVQMPLMFTPSQSSH